VAASLLWGSVPTWAQAQLGDQLALNAGGSISAGYTGSFTNEGPSSHGIIFGGNGDISGSYHSPQFLSFDVSPFYNQSRNDSTFQSLTDSSGVTASAAIFAGSKYPGYVNYSRVYNSEGNYFVPGIANYRTNGDSQDIGVGWSFTPTSNLSLRTGYQQGDNNFSLYGVNGENFSHFHSFFAGVTYALAGFNFGGGVTNTDSNNSLPLVQAGQSTQLSQADSTTYYFNMSRAVGLSGNTWMSVSRNDTSYNVLGTNDTETTDVVTGGVTLKPLRKLSTSFNADYDDNLAGTIYQAETNAGVLAPQPLPAEKSHSWGVSAEAQYTVADQFYVSGDISHRQQVFLGTAFDSTAYSGDVSYGHELWGGRFTAGTVVTESFLGNGGGSMLGVLSNAIYIRKIGQWSLSGSAGYSRNVQTLLIAYTTSGYNYSVSATHRLGRLYWNGAAGGSKSVLSQVNGANSLTQNYSTGLSSSRLGVSAGYAKSSGMGLYTAQGITSLPTGLPPTLLPTTVLYGGTSYSAGVGGTPIRGLTFSGTYIDSKSNTENSSVASNNDTEEASVYLQYKVRKIFFTAGYSRLVQGFSASATAPAMVSTYYVGLSRWFNFF
jgi:hypothetical protein